MENQDSNDAPEAPSYSKVDIPQCEVVIEEIDNFGDEPSTQQENSITYVVIPDGSDPLGVMVDYWETVSDETLQDETELESASVQSAISTAQNQCTLCGESFKNCFVLQKHFSAVHAHGDLTCQICRIQCATEDQLMRHYNKHKYSCNLCEASFSKNNDLLNHKKIHSQTLPYACNICNEAYSSTREISAHIRATHGQKRYIKKEEDIKEEVSH